MLDQQYIRQSGLIARDKIQDLPISIVGAGGIGSWTALALTKMGAGAVEVIDFDTVEEHNLGSQFYSETDIGFTKVDALSQRLSMLTGNRIKPTVGEWNPHLTRGQGIVIAAVDNMATRKALFENTVGFFIDGRMAGNAINLYCVDTWDSEQVINYTKTLFSDEQAEPLPCSERAVVYNTLIIGGLIADYVAQIANGKTPPFELIVDLANFSMYGGL